MKVLHILYGTTVHVSSSYRPLKQRESGRVDEATLYQTIVQLLNASISLEIGQSEHKLQALKDSYQTAKIMQARPSLLLKLVDFD